MAQVLVLEPDVRLAKLYAKALLTRRHSVNVATTAQDAIISADEHKPDVVLLELQLTAHGGIEFLYEFRSYTDWITIPVIIVSGVPPATLEQSKDLLYGRLGVIAYHYKPRTNLQAILRAVDSALEGGTGAGQPD